MRMLKYCHVLIFAPARMSLPAKSISLKCFNVLYSKKSCPTSIP